MCTIKHLLTYMMYNSNIQRQTIFEEHYMIAEKRWSFYISYVMPEGTGDIVARFIYTAIRHTSGTKTEGKRIGWNHCNDQ